MSPMQLIDGSIRREDRLENQSATANRRLTELAAAVRDHEHALRRSRPFGLRGPDDELYRRLRQICG